MPSALEDFLDSKHPIFVANEAAWLQNERRIRGGRPVIETELQRFIWETATADSFTARKRQAVYPNFELAFLMGLYGHILREAPAADDINFGTLGKVVRDGTSPSQAELIFYNVDGVGGDGQQFYAWLLGLACRAGATGHRWVMVEASEERPTTRADELAGRRPYAVEYSPLAVPNWHIERGQLQWAIVRPTVRKPAVVDGNWQGDEYAKHYLLLVRAGTETLRGLGDQYAAGGWWEFDADKKATERFGTWEKTKGEIPMSLLYFLTDRSDDPDYPAMSQNGVDALGNLSSAYMNLESARWSDAWSSASSLVFLLGADAAAHNLVVEKIKDGSRIIPVPETASGTAPQIAHGSQGAVTAEVFKGILSDILDLAEQLAKDQATSTPDSSGRSKIVGFAQQRGPLLAVAAENLETFVNSFLRFFELRFGHQTPRAEIRLPREYDTAPLEEQIGGFFETFRLSRLRSPTLEADAMLTLAEQAGLLADDAAKEIVRNELRTSAEAGQRAAAQAGAEEDELDAILSGTGAGA